MENKNQGDNCDIVDFDKIDKLFEMLIQEIGKIPANEHLTLKEDLNDLDIWRIKYKYKEFYPM